MLAEPGRALLYRGGDTFRLSHPYHRDAPDRSTVIEFGDELLEEMFGARSSNRDLGFHLHPRTLMAERLALRLLEAADDVLDGEEAGLMVLQAVVGDFGTDREDRPDLPSARRSVDLARERITASAGDNLALEDLAREVAVSPFHLTRLFRRITGLTMRGYRMRLRLAIALDRVAEGEEDLAGLAADLGFSHHSHLSSSFRRHLGMSPSALRKTLRVANVSEIRRFLTAPIRSAG